MKSIIIPSVLVVVFFVSSSFLSAQDTIGSGGWEPYMSTPKSQNASTGPTCETYSAIHAMEGLYNYLFGLSANQLSLDPNSVTSGATPAGVFDAIDNDGCRAVQGINSFPNYDHAVYSLSGKSGTSSPSLNWIETNISQAPICIRCLCYRSLQSTVETVNYQQNPYPLDPTNDTSLWHYVTIADVRITPGGRKYFVCISSYGLTGSSDGTRFYIYESASGVSFTDWCDEAAYPLRTIENPKKPKIFPGFDSPFSSTTMTVWKGGEAAYVTAGIDLGSSVSVPYGKTIYVEPDDAVSSHTIRVGSGQTLTLADGATITRLGNSGYWAGITIQSGGSMVFWENSTIEFAKTGITSYSSMEIKTYSLSGYSGIIQHCRDFGIYVYNSSPLIQYIKVTDNHDSNYPYSTGIRVAGSQSDPTINKVTIDGSRTEFSMDPYTNATLKYSDLKNTANVVDNIYIGSYAFVDMDGLYDFYGGKNNIYTGTGYTINNPCIYTIPAGYNYWHSTPAPNFYVASRITMRDFTQTTPYANGAPQKPALLPSNAFADAREREAAKDWNGAINLYRSILASSEDVITNRKAVKSILRTSELRNLENKISDFTEIRSIIQAELQSATSDYKAVLDYLLCEILLKEGKYTEAIKSFTDTAARYFGTSMEVEMLSRIATIYGLYLHDTRKAREYADAAAAINPGQECLYIAYRTAGVDYQPWQYADRYKGIQENFDSPPEQPKTATESEYVTVSPNPANPVTTISYSLKNPSDVRLTVYAVNGQKVATLVNGPMRAGAHSVTFDGSKLASGVYFYRFVSAGLTRSGKMLLLK